MFFLLIHLDVSALFCCFFGVVFLLLRTGLVLDKSSLDSDMSSTAASEVEADAAQMGSTQHLNCRMDASSHRGLSAGWTDQKGPGSTNKSSKFPLNLVPNCGKDFFLVFTRIWDGKTHFPLKYSRFPNAFGQGCKSVSSCKILRFKYCIYKYIFLHLKRSSWFKCRVHILCKFFIVTNSITLIPSFWWKKNNVSRIFHSHSLLQHRSVLFAQINFRTRLFYLVLILMC